MEKIRKVLKDFLNKTEEELSLSEGVLDRHYKMEMEISRDTQLYTENEVTQLRARRLEILDALGELN